MTSAHYDVLIIGSGFGGSVTAMRLAEKGYHVGVLEAGKRYDTDDLPTSSWDTRRFVWAPRLGCFGIQRIHLLRDVVISEGTLSASLVHPREVFKPAILESAASIILVHNHPSGDPTPSREDLRLTRQLVDCSELLDLRIHDHVIIGRERFISLAQRGALSGPGAS